MTEKDFKEFADKVKQCLQELVDSRNIGDAIDGSTGWCPGLCYYVSGRLYPYTESPGRKHLLVYDSLTSMIDDGGFTANPGLYLGPQNTFTQTRKDFCLYVLKHLNAKTAGKVFTEKTLKRPSLPHE